MPTSNNAPVSNAPTYLTVDEVAARLRMQRRTVTKLVAEGVIPAVRLGKLYRFDADKIAALFDAKN